MTVKFCVGNVLVSPDEYRAAIKSGNAQRYRLNLPIASLDITGRPLELVQVSRARDDLAGIRKENFEPIGLGKPLSIEIYTIYTGDVPRNYFGGSPGLLVCSAVKTEIGNTEAKPRAINMLFDTVTVDQYISNSAMTIGTPIVFYTQSVVSESIMVSFEFSLDKLKENDINQLKQLFTMTASVPVFVPAAAYLLAGGTIIDILESLVKTFRSVKPYLHDDVTLRLYDPMFDPFSADALALYRSQDEKEFEGFERKVVKEGPGKEYLALVNPQTQTPYHGKAPYIMAVFDGRDRSRSLKDFTPTLASAAILEQFYSGKPTEQAISAVKEAMNLDNDSTYNQKAEKIKGQLANVNPNMQEYKDLKLQFDAYNSGIQDDKFKVKL